MPIARDRRSRLAAAVFLLLWFGFAARVSLASDLLVRDWTPSSDVRQQSVRALLATHDGYLWLGTGNGLMRFDGVSFTSFTPDNTEGLLGRDIVSNTLYEDATGAIWAGTYGQGVIRNDHGHFSSFQKAQGLADLDVLRVDGDQAGSVWIYTAHGVNKWQNGRLEHAHPEEDGSRPSLLVPQKADRGRDFDKIGLWRRTPAGLQRFAYGSWHLFPTPPDEKPRFEDDVRSIYEDKLGRVWYSISSQRGNYFCVQNGALRIFKGLPTNAFVTYQDREGFLWMNDHGVHPSRWKDGKVYPLPELRTPSLLNVVEQTDGTIWAASFTELFEYRQKRIEVIPTSGTPEIGSVLFQQRNGAIWAGGQDLLGFRGEDKGGQNRFFEGPHVSTADSFLTVRALSEDADGHLLIASRHRPRGEIVSNGKLQPYLARELDSPIRAMLLSSSGDQWLGTDGGLYRYSRQKPTEPEQLLRGTVRCLAKAGSDAVWVGTDEGPVLFEHSLRRSYPGESSWHFGAVQSILATRFGEVWMATSDHGIVRLAWGKFRAFETRDGLPTNQIRSVSVDAKDDLWVRSDVGLLRILRRSIERQNLSPASKLQVTLIDQGDGLPAANMEPAGNQGFLNPFPDTLWFSTPGGIAALHPSDFAQETSSPRAVIEEHVIDQSSRMPGSSVVLAPGQNNLQLHYTALGSNHPEQVAFRYRLHGFDRDWISAGNRRVAYYTQLPPGSYLFEVQAADGNAEGWPASGASADIRVLTPFYRARWFKLLVLLAALGIVAFLANARRQIAAERTRVRQAFTHKLIATQEGERKRIAHELHDSIGQHLVLIRNLAMLSSLEKGSGTDGHVDAIAEQAMVAIKEVEAISYDLRPYQLDRLGLTKAVLSSIQTFERSSSMVVRCSVHNIDDFFPKDMEINFYRIVQEALGNILRHAEATEASVTVVRSEHWLRLTIRDNGRGFPSTSAEAQGSGLGLVGIQERAEALGGRAAIESAPSAGTLVAVEVTRVAPEGEHHGDS